MGRHYEDFETGEIIETPRRTIVDADIFAFAGLTSDFNPLHTDDVFAAESDFGGRIAHGPMLIGMAFGFGARAGLFDGTVLGLLGLEWTFAAPVRPSDTIGARISVLGKRATRKPDRGVVDFQFDLVNQDGTAVQSGRAKILMKARSVLACPLEAQEALLSLAAVKRSGAPVVATDGASLWDFGDGVGCFEIHTKMNAFDDSVLDALEQALEIGPRTFRALVIGNEDPRTFSAGGNLRVLLGAIEASDLAGFEAFIARGQTAFSTIRRSPIPVVGAAFGFALGGGCEILLHCDAIVAHAELKAGLPETRVGLLPGWGGCTQLLLRHADRQGSDDEPFRIVEGAFESLMSGGISTSAEDARDLLILRAADPIVPQRERLLGKAKERALGLANTGYAAPGPRTLALGGAASRSRLLEMAREGRLAGDLTETDEVIAGHLATVLTADAAEQPASEDLLMRLEREALRDLARTTATRARIAHMLASGVPLRN